MRSRRAATGNLHLILSFSSTIVVFFTNTVKFGSSVHLPCIVIAPGVITIVGDSMEHASSLVLECTNLILEPRVLQSDVPPLIQCWMGPNLPHQCLKRQ